MTNVLENDVAHELHIDEPITPRQQFIFELRNLLTLLESDPKLPLPHDVGANHWSPLTFFPSDARQAANLVKALGGKWEKNDPNKSEHDASYLIMNAQLGMELNVRVIVSREGVCEKKVVGTEKRKVEKVVIAQVTEEVYEDVDVIKFECKSLMSLADQQVMAELEAVAS